MKICILYLLFYLFSIHSQAQNTIITGHSFERKSIFVSLQDELGNNLSSELQFDFLNNTNLPIEIKLTSPKLAYLVAPRNTGSNIYYFLIFPEDSIHIIQKEGKYTITGKYGGEYMFFNDLDKRNVGITNFQHLNHSKESFIALDSQRHILLKKYADSLGFRNEFLITARQMFKFRYIQNYLQPYAPDTLGFDYDKIVDEEWKDKLSSLKDSFLENSDSLSIFHKHYMFFRTAIRTFNRFLTEPDFHKMPSFDQQFYGAIKNFRGIQRDILLTDLLIQQKKLGDITPVHYQVYRQTCKSQKYITLIDELTGEQNERINLPVIITNSVNIHGLKNNPLFHFPNNEFIFVVFWASWCSPCLKELPEIKNLEKEYQRKVLHSFMYL